MVGGSRNRHVACGVGYGAGINGASLFYVRRISGVGLRRER